MFELRPYQRDLVDRVQGAWREGYQAPCVVLPCGGGKSVIVAQITKNVIENGGTVLFLVHRKELVAQIYATFVRFKIDIERCRIEMVQTLSRHPEKIANPDLIITDENHHSLAKSYKKIYEHFKDSKRLGVTATPERLGGMGLKEVNDILIEGVTAKWLIDNYYLSPYLYYAPPVMENLPKFHTRKGDYIQSEVTDFFRQKKIYGNVIKQYRKIADGKQAICYLPTVEFSKEISQKFNNAGISSAHIDGETPSVVRNAIIEKFRQGEIKILCNVDIISEGFDVPDCECAILLRPTKSLTLFIQQSMRCMRYKEGKTAVIIDHVGNYLEHGFPDDDRQWSLDGHPKKSIKQGEMPVKVCPRCYCTVSLNTYQCTNCGYEFERKTETTQTLDVDLKRLDIAEREKLRFENKIRRMLSYKECQTYNELLEFARQHNYKKGWAYYKAKELNIIGNQKSRGNTTPKRYPCKAVGMWLDSEK